MIHLPCIYLLSQNDERIKEGKFLYCFSTRITQKIKMLLSRIKIIWNHIMDKAFLQKIVRSPYKMNLGVAMYSLVSLNF